MVITDNAVDACVLQDMPRPWRPDVVRCKLLAVAARHANGPEHDDRDRYKSCGGHIVLLAEDQLLRSTPVRVAVLDWRSDITHRVCRYTLAAAARHLADAVEAVDWATMVLRDVSSAACQPQQLAGGGGADAALLGDGREVGL